ncbi:putative undecaprenol kinase [Corallococcus macrosporus]|uniref:Putative undecaprenol kinase n=1 Tax=Myxococcus fulvus (strain ATCC BAA-855 / HW-1) TaxID=483219 RepID=F8CCX8_MYXFH|nr:putative undecaprenol kinase [Corallococcus macrosporus]
MDAPSGKLSPLSGTENVDVPGEPGTPPVEKQITD